MCIRDRVDVLVNNGYGAVPEKGAVDVVCGDAAIELKTVNTNYLCEGTAYKQKGITQNTAEIVADIRKLEKLDYLAKIIVFVAYPLVHEHPEWQNRHLPKIGKFLSRSNYEEIIFANNVKGVLYAGLLGSGNAPV